jgi:hypothetical protein
MQAVSNGILQTLRATAITKRTSVQRKITNEPHKMPTQDSASEAWQRPVASGLSAIAATAFTYPASRVLSHIQKKDSPIREAVKVITNDHREPKNMYTGAKSSIIASVPQRILGYMTYAAIQEHLQKKTEAPQLLQSLTASAMTSLVDSVFGGTGEIMSIKQQDNAAIGYKAFYTNPAIRRGLALVVKRDLISNTFGYSLPQEIRKQGGLDDSRYSRIGSTFVSTAISNILTTPIDAMKRHVISNPEMTIREAGQELVKTKGQGLVRQYIARLGTVSLRFTLFLIGAEELRNHFATLKKRDAPRHA